MSITTNQAIEKLRKFYLQYKRLPSYTEIAHLFHYASRNAGVKLAKKLIQQGILGKDDTGKLTPRKLFTLPHFGYIKAGYPTEASPIADDLDLYQFLLHLPAESFSLTVKGDSMSNAGIHEGDIILVSKERQPKKGDIVAACLDGEWTVKYFQTDEKGIRLVPANPNYPMFRPTTNIFIGGVVIHVIRSYK